MCPAFKYKNRGFSAANKRAKSLSCKNATKNNVRCAVVVEAEDEKGCELFFTLCNSIDSEGCAIILACDSDKISDLETLWIIPDEEFAPLTRAGSYDFSIKIYPQADVSDATKVAKSLGAKQKASGTLEIDYFDNYALEKFAVDFARLTCAGDEKNRTFTRIESERIVFPLFVREDLKNKYFFDAKVKTTSFFTRAGECAQSNYLIATGARSGKTGYDDIISLAKRFAEDHNG
jgi:hypothetical protein